MTQHSDAQLLAALRRALDAVDGPPEHVLAGAREAFVWRTIDAELAELVFDSAADEQVGVRGADATREMTFRTPQIEIEVMAIGHERMLLGQVVPPQTAEVELLHRAGSTTATTDELGRFSFSDVPPGNVKLVIVTAAGDRIQTEGLSV